VLSFLVKAYVVLGFSWALLKIYFECCNMRDAIHGKRVVLYGMTQAHAEARVQMFKRFVVTVQRNYLPAPVVCMVIAVTVVCFSLWQGVIWPRSVWRLYHYKGRAIVEATK
jgi:hypothetical protein